MNRDLVGRTYDLGEHRVRRAEIDRYAAVAGGPTPVFGIVPVWHGIRLINLDPELGLDIGRIVHGEQRMSFSRPYRDGQRLRSTGTIESIHDRGRNEVLTMRLDSAEEGTPVASQWVIAVSRGTAAGEAAAVAARPPAPATPDEAPPADAERSFRLAEDVTYRYAEASGDDNLIHTDPEFARSVGLPGIIVQGMCMLHVSTRQVMDFLGAEPAAIATIGVRFASMLEPGRDLLTRIWRTPEGARFEALGPDGRQVLRDGTVGLRG